MQPLTWAADEFTVGKACNVHPLEEQDQAGEVGLLNFSWNFCLHFLVCKFFRIQAEDFPWKRIQENYVFKNASSLALPD